MVSEFAREVVSIIESIPEGSVATYGQIAGLAGNPRAARQVARFLHSMSEKYNLPWHRVVNSQGRISLPEPFSDYQKGLLLSEGIEFSPGDRIDLKRFGFRR